VIIPEFTISNLSSQHETPPISAARKLFSGDKAVMAQLDKLKLHDKPRRSTEDDSAPTNPEEKK
jgi:hypothetical protein